MTGPTVTNDGKGKDQSWEAARTFHFAYPYGSFATLDITSWGATEVEARANHYKAIRVIMYTLKGYLLDEP